MRSSVDLFQHVSMQMKVLDFWGLSLRIPYSKKSVYFWLAVLTRVVVVVFVFVIPSGGEIIYVIRLLRSGKAEVQEVASITNLILTELLGLLKLMDMRLRRKEFELLVDQLTSEEFRFSSEPLQVILARAVRVSKLLFIGFVVSSSVDVLAHVVIVPGLNGFKTLPLKWDLIYFDVNDQKYFNYIYAYQVLYKPVSICVFIVMQTLAWAAMSFAVSQLDVLIYNFENMKELVKAAMNERRCDENEAFKQTFRSCVLHHFAIKRFINTLQAVFSVQLASSLVLEAVVIVFTATQFFSIESPFKNISEVLWVSAYMIIFILNLFVDSYFGNSVTIKCAHLSSVVFGSPWINLKVELKKDVVLFMAWTQQPVVIKAAKLIPVSLTTFTKIMNWTYKGFAVMNQMK